jgi:3',5'-cyclic AMP phosphodiesterase CpdA
MRKTIAHLSDLHFGASQTTPERAKEIVRALLIAGIDHVVVTGDITDNGRDHELRLFHQAFSPLLDQGRLTVVPGNHDRLGDDAGTTLMGGKRVDTVELPGTLLIRVDSTGPHNRSSVLAGHGDVCEQVLDDISEALAAAPPGVLVVMLLHHHPVFLPEEGLLERLASTFNLPFAAELTLGDELLRRALGRCDLILHGHRHVPSARILAPGGPRPLGVYNAGCTVARRGMNVFTHSSGVLRGEPRWLQVGTQAAAGFLEIPPYQPAEYRLTT